MPGHTEQAAEVLEFWFVQSRPRQWFAKDPAFDALLRFARFPHQNALLEGLSHQISSQQQPPRSQVDATAASMIPVKEVSTSCATFISSLWSDSTRSMTTGRIMPNPQPIRPSDVLTGRAYSFARISDYVSNVEINNLVVDGLNSFLSIGKDSIVTVRDSIFRYMGDFGQHPAPLFGAFEDSTLNLQRVVISHINNFQKPISNNQYVWYPTIAGSAATLNMERSTLDLLASATGGGIGWSGGTANVVSSVILGQGLSISDYLLEGVLNVVNSVVRPYNHSATARIQAYDGGEANVVASTIQYDATFTGDVNGCPADYTCNGAPLQAFNGGTINLSSSVASVINSDLPQIDLPYSDEYSNRPGTLNADAYSFVQPVDQQNAAALKILFGQPNLLTSGVPYALTPNIAPYPPIYVSLPTGAYPLTTSPLIDVVPDANGANQLINPIDGSVISTDVYGNPRTSNGQRDVGAVQTAVPGPLPLLGCGAAFGWSRRLRQRIRRGAGHGESRTAG